MELSFTRVQHTTRGEASHFAQAVRDEQEGQTGDPDEDLFQFFVGQITELTRLADFLPVDRFAFRVVPERLLDGGLELAGKGPPADVRLIDGIIDHAGAKLPRFARGLVWRALGPSGTATTEPSRIPIEPDNADPTKGAVEALFYNGDGRCPSAPWLPHGDSMPDTRELRSVVEAAEQAAATGDYASAERHLREAVLLQEAGLGPLHPDLANTLNNLGVVCEMADKPEEAEQCYRRAHAIATAALEPDHPFVATSRKNLEDFYQARRTPVDVPAPPGAIAQAPGSADQPRERQAREEAAPVPVRKSSHSFAIGAVSVSALVVVMILIAARPWFDSNDAAGSSPVSATEPPPPSAAPTSEPTRVEPLPAAKETTARSSAPVEVRERRATPMSTAAPPTVVNARLCSNLSTGARDWRCDPAGSAVNPGSLFFYTRLRAARDTTVLHRWYRGDRLQQAVELRVQANPGSGYRTYSRRTMTAESAGDWRVELRTRDGTLLHEERFTVR